VSTSTSSSLRLSRDGRPGLWRPGETPQPRRCVVAELVPHPSSTNTLSSRCARAATPARGSPLFHTTPRAASPTRADDQ
jgi:hypothetical protein